MSDDLISRKALFKDFEKTITGKSDTYDWLRMISRQPVAYDVDKVIEQFESTKWSESDVFRSVVCHAHNEQVDKCIEIVKAGGK